MNIARTPAATSDSIMIRLNEPAFIRAPINTCAAGGMIVRATITEATNANVLVNAKGRNSFPSAAIIVNTGRKLTTVVDTAVRTALATSWDARNITCARFSDGSASSKCFNMFSQRIIPISTIVPIAIAMPDNATMFASTPNVFMAIKHINTASGSNALMRNELLKCSTITRITIMVTRISSERAVLSVPSVS